MIVPSAQSVVIYDGSCTFCQRQIARIRRRDRAGRLEFVPRQTPGLEERFPRLAQSDFNTGMRLITPEGRIYVGADAVYHVVRQLAVWRWWAWLYRVPGIHVLARWAYAWIAAHRYSLSQTCAEGTCTREHEPNPSEPSDASTASTLNR